MRDAFEYRPTTLADYLAILRRRIGIIVIPTVVAAIAAYAAAQAQSPLYRASAELLVNRSSVVSAITNVSDPSVGDPNRFLATEASIARSPELAARVASAAGVPGVTGDAVMGASSVTPHSEADLLDVAVTWPNARDAVQLTNTYAREFARYKTELDTARINDALRSLKQRIKSLQATGATSSQSYSTLTQYQSQLETIGTLLANNTSVLRPASGADNVRPRPKRRALLGALLGGVVGVALAFLAEALDRRVRSVKEVEEVLGLPLIGRVPPPPANLRKRAELVMLAEPASIQAESFRKLKTTIEFLNRAGGARTIMITSAVPREGKSTTIANLAVAFARSGKRVALVDLDLRRPFLHTFFSTDNTGGISDVILGRLSLAHAIRSISLPANEAVGRVLIKPAGGVADPRANGTTLLHFLPVGTIPSTGSDGLVDLLGNERLGRALTELAEQFDLVLVDTPPILAAGDAMTLTSRVDAVAVVLHAAIERPLLHEIARQLRNSQAPTLGFILTGVPAGDGYGYGYSYSYSYAPSSTSSDTEKGRAAGQV